MPGEYSVEYDYPYDWSNGGVAHFDTEEAAIDWAKKMARGVKGQEGYCKVTVYRQTLVAEVN